MWTCKEQSCPGYLGWPSVEKAYQYYEIQYYVHIFQILSNIMYISFKAGSEITQGTNLPVHKCVRLHVNRHSEVYNLNKRDLHSDDEFWQKKLGNIFLPQKICFSTSSKKHRLLLFNKKTKAKTKVKAKKKTATKTEAKTKATAKAKAKAERKTICVHLAPLSGHSEGCSTKHHLLVDHLPGNHIFIFLTFPIFPHIWPGPDQPIPLAPSDDSKLAIGWLPHHVSEVQLNAHLIVTAGK